MSLERLSEDYGALHLMDTDLFCEHAVTVYAGMDRVESVQRPKGRRENRVHICCH